MIQSNGISGKSKKNKFKMSKEIKIVVLGGSGMLGSMINDFISRNSNFTITSTVRNNELMSKCKSVFPKINWEILDVSLANENELDKVIGDSKWLINAIGVIKPYINEQKPFEIERAIKINSSFPYLLARIAKRKGAKILQIATDCVYSGKKGSYVEDDLHDALDVYGKSKSLGECYSDVVSNIRCSIIGPEFKANLSLLQWFLGQPDGTRLNGFINHDWNGITTLHFAKICYSIIRNKFEIGHLHHLIPSDKVNKYELLVMFKRYFGRENLVISPRQADQCIDRTLSTKNQELNLRIWNSVGFANPPSVEEMIKDLGKYKYSFL